MYLALENNLEIIPVLNKIDLPSADIDRARREIEEVIGLDCSERDPGQRQDRASASRRSSRRSSSACRRPRATPTAPLRALIFDSWYDSYRGAVVMVRVVDGTLRKGQKIRLMATEADYEVTEIGVFAPFPRGVKELGPGEVGFFAGSIKSVHDTKIGDTVTDAKRPGHRAAARLQRREADGVRGHLPDRPRQVRGPARRARASCT